MKRLPNFPQQIPLQYEHQEMISSTLKEKGILSSDFAFYNLMGWYLNRPPNISRLHEHVLLNLEGPDGKCLLMPPIGLGPIQPAVATLLDLLPGLGCPRMLSYVPGSLREEIAAAFPQVRCEPQQNDFDYLYSRKELSELAGRKFHQKKNFVNRVIEDWNPGVQALTAGTIDRARDYLQHWYEDIRSEDPTLKIEALAAERLLPNLDQIGGLGILVEIEGEIAGVSVASPITRDCYVVSLEKADKDRKGLYQFINWTMANRLPPFVELLNRETDLGIPGLRHAKASYHPLRLEEKYTLFFD
jgi:hypothetical protein